MKLPFIRSIVSLAAAFVLQLVPVFGGDMKTDQALDYLNARLAHSAFIRVDANGLVQVKAPDRILKFNLKDVAFSYNGLNDDDRLRVVGDACIESYDGDRLDEVFNRESFVCRSHSAAREAIETLRQLKRNYTAQDDRFAHLQKALNPGDPESKYTTLGEALDFVNDQLSRTAVINVDAKGYLFMNGPDQVYRVDLKKAEFCFNDRNDDPMVRIYGDWALGTFRKGSLDQELARESFTAVSRRGAYLAIKALYFIKGVYTGLDAPTINALKNVTGRRTYEYNSIPGAIEVINDRLAVSILQGIDAKGEITVNASENVYRIDITKCEFERAQGRHGFDGILQRMFGWSREEGVSIRSKDGIKQYRDSQSYRTVGEETFSSESSSDTREIIKALEFIKASVKAGGAH